ncbi:MAG: hypothetical protein K0R15_943 [Clostridiales bacterium]|nr:hypothetical protein [Clostridiales bacterium]
MIHSEIALALTMAGCKDKKEGKVEFPFPTPVECTEFNLPEGFNVISSISTTKDNKFAFISAGNPDSSDPQDFVKVFMFTKTKDGWSEPVSLDFGSKIFPAFTVVASDGSKLFFTGVDGEDYMKNAFNTPFLIYSADISGENVTNITLLENLKDSKANIITGIDNNNNLIFTKHNVEKGTASVCYAELVNGDYKVYEVKTNSDELKGEIINISPVDDEKYIFMYSSLDKILNIYTADIKNGIVENAEAISTNIETKDSAVMSPTISGDGKLLYFIQNQTLYKISLGAAIADTNKIFEIKDKVTTTATEETDEYVASSSDEFDTSNFELKLRNKSDISTKEGVYYEIFVRSFADSDGNGIGDFNGITAKLDYLADLGIDGLWLMPINQSPSYHGYDITDYYTLNSDYGTEEDFKKLLDAAHERGIKIIMDYVINHTSDQHPWFVGSKSGEDNEFRNYYRWVSPADTVDYSVTDKSPWKSSVWYKSGNSFYYGIFWSGMPDLNYNNPKVREEIKAAAVKWLEMGVDGFRLDAAMHVYGDNEFKQQEDQLASNLQWWNEFALFCESINPEVYLVGEAWQDSEVLAEYVQPFDTKFNFSFEQDMINAVVNEKAVSSNGQSLASSLQTILDEYKKIDTNYLDGIFGTNHDQDRIMNRVKNIDKAKLVVNIYMTLSGNPFIYYGEEIGMLGAKPDEKIREPFKWTVSGTDMDTTWERAASNSATVSLEEQIKDPTSLFNHYKKIIALRKANAALTSGSYTALELDNNVIMAYYREVGDEKVYVVHNLSSQTVKLPLAEIVGGEVIYSSNNDTKIEKDGVTLGAYSSIIIKK